MAGVAHGHESPLRRAAFIGAPSSSLAFHPSPLSCRSVELMSIVRMIDDDHRVGRPFENVQQALNLCLTYYFRCNQQAVDSSVGHDFGFAHEAGAARREAATGPRFPVRRAAGGC